MLPTDQVVVPVFFMFMDTFAVCPGSMVVGTPLCEINCALFTKGLETVTVTAAEVVILPAASRATAVKL